MNPRIVVVLAVLALVLLLLLVLGGDPQVSEQGLQEDGRSEDPRGPHLKAAGTQPAEPPSGAKPAEPPSVPAATPERPVDAAGIRVRLSGRVIDPKGTPLPDIPVRVYAYFESSAPKVRRHAETITDAQGRFALDFRPQATATTRDPWVRMRVAAFHPTWIMAVTGAYVNSGQVADDGYVRRDIELRMRPAFRLLCKVRDEDGRPIANATCALEQFYGRKRFVDGRLVEAQSDESGEARLTLPLLGDDVILLRLHGHNAFRVSAPGYATVYARVRVPEVFKPGHVVETTVVLTAPFELRGILRDDLGAPIGDTAFSVTGTRLKTWAALVYTRWADHALRTDEAGGFILPAVQEGTWRLEFEAEGYRTARLEAATGAKDLEVTLLRRAPTVVLFRDAKTKAFLRVQGYDVRLESGGGSATSGGAAEARLELEDLPPGKHELTVQFAGRAQPFTVTFTAEPGTTEPLIFEVPQPVGGATIEGVVVDPGGRLLANAWMTLARATLNEEEDAATEDELNWQTQVDGAFRFEGVKPGRYTLEVQANKFAERRLTIDVPDESPRDLLRIALSPGATLRIEFPALPDDAGWTYDARVLQAEGFGVSGRFMGESAKNSVVFEHQAPGEVWVVLETSQFRTRRYDGDPFLRRVVLAEGEESVVSYATARAVRVAGQVLGKNGKPLAVGTLQLRRIMPTFALEDVLTNTFYGGKSAPTDPQGAFSFDGLLPGRYAVANLSKDGKPLTFIVTDVPIEDLVLSCDG